MICAMCNQTLFIIQSGERARLAWPAGLGQCVPSKATFILLEIELDVMPCDATL